MQCHFLFSKTFRQTLHPPPISLFYLYHRSFGGLKRTAPSSAAVRNKWSYTSTPPIRLFDVDRDRFPVQGYGLQSLTCSGNSRTFIIHEVELPRFQHAATDTCHQTHPHSVFNYLNIIVPCKGRFS